jgi:maltose O-acetyltransferase
MNINHVFRNRYRKDQIRRGLNVGKNVYITDSVKIDHEFCWLVTIGDDSVLAHNVVILCHDASAANLTGIHKIGKVVIGCRTFLGAGTIVLPGVKIGNDVIVGAGSVVTHDIPDNSVVVGNPARVIESISSFVEKYVGRQSQFDLLQLKQQTLQSKESKTKIKKALAKCNICYLSFH